jgi:O-acetyl-ADP-ribose deacetylase (regulator of RNase III)
MPFKIEIVLGDITEIAADAIVNAANNHLWMGSGVAGAIKRKGGVEIEQDAISKGPLEVGQAVASIAGKLPYKYIIHAAGMGQDLRTSRNIVFESTRNSLLLADSLNLKSLAFPAIGTGVGGLSTAVCAGAMLDAVRQSKTQLKNLEKVIFVLFDRQSTIAFQREADNEI